MTKYIYWLKELDKNSIPIAGGKGANLGEMYRANFPVPNAFVVSADTYWDFIEKTDIKSHIESLLSGININDTESLNDITAQIRKLILQAKIPSDISQAIKEAYIALEAGGPEKLTSENKESFKMSTNQPFTAVRSSATAEDLPDASFAGQQDTYLNVKGTSNVVNAVRKCWASLFTARSTYYREKNDYPHMQVKIAVIVQEMVDSERAGVAFTRDPVSGDEKITIEAGWGLGEFVVSGTISPDNYVVDANTLEIIAKRKGRQEIMSTKDPVSGESVTVKVPPSKEGVQILSDNEIKELARILRSVHNHYNSPQDIEWAYDNGKFYIVQSRPVTTIKEKKEESAPEQSTGKVILDGLPASPGVVTGKVHIIKDLHADAGLFKEGEILVTRMTDPDYVPLMQKARAIITDDGGSTAHAAIVSRELGVPCIVGTHKATQVLKDGQMITVDATSGKIYEGGKEEMSSTPETQVQVVTQQHIVTGTKVYMNLGIPEKAEEYSKLDVDGVGLMREEFIIASNMKEHPLYLIEKGEGQKFVDVLVEGITKMCSAFAPRPVVLRFSDFKSNEYNEMEGGSKYEPKEENPMIGWRGVSRYISEKYEKAFRLECKAVRKVRESHRNLWVMLPFVRTVEELKKVLSIMKEEGLERTEDFKIWLMAEVPSNIFLADKFSKYCDGFSIGSNDLTQLVLGVDRDSAILGETRMYDERNPAVKRAISKLISVAHKHGKTVSICGQAPSVYQEFVEFLVKKGIDSVSVNPDTVTAVRNTIARIERRILVEKGLESEIPNQEEETTSEESNKSDKYEEEISDEEETTSEESNKSDKYEEETSNKTHNNFYNPFGDYYKEPEPPQINDSTEEDDDFFEFGS